MSSNEERAVRYKQLARAALEDALDGIEEGKLGRSTEDARRAAEYLFKAAAWQHEADTAAALEARG